MNIDIPHVCVCVCTFQRPALLRRLLRALRRLHTEGRFSYSVVVVDNDAEATASVVVDEAMAGGGVPVKYGVEAERSIALARNKACALAHGEFLAWIDDDEFPADDWLIRLFDTCQGERVAGVLGPVLPHFDAEPPSWIVKGRFYQRPRHTTGFRVGWQEARTGNVLLRRDVVEEMGEPFRREFPNGGEDQDFFRRAMSMGHTFIWCDEGIVFETVAPSRWKRSVMLRRAVLRGRNSIKHPTGRAQNLLRSLVAVPAYTLALPISLMLGHHWFMRLVIKLCDHLGRLLAAVGLNPVSERQM